MKKYILKLISLKWQPCSKAHIFLKMMMMLYLWMSVDECLDWIIIRLDEARDIEGIQKI